MKTRRTSNSGAKAPHQAHAQPRDKDGNFVKKEGVERYPPTKANPEGRIKYGRAGKTRKTKQTYNDEQKQRRLEQYHEKKGTYAKPVGVDAPPGTYWNYKIGKWVPKRASKPSSNKPAAKKPAAKKPASRKRSRSPSPPPAPLSEYELFRQANIDRAFRRPRVHRPSRT